jgi:formate hydrogenlyase subunit 6/NADH:ubiquinone oxidoreductase subunit I
LGKKALSPMIKEVLLQIFTKPATSKYPLVKASVPEDFRGKQVFDINLCVGCGLCSRDCPAKAIEMVAVDEIRRPLFHLDLCIFCYQCAEGCPRNAIKSSMFFELASTNKSDLVITPKASAQKKSGVQ